MSDYEAILRANSSGQLTLEIPDATGEYRPYTIRRAPAGLSLWAVVLTRVDTQSSYRVALDRDQKRQPRRWRCTCPDAKYHKSQRPHCKHVDAVDFVRLALQTLLVEPPAPAPLLPQPEPARTA